MSLALIAGQGRLPEIVADAAAPAVIAALHGFPPDTLQPTHTFRVETLGTLLHALTDAGITEVCFAGRIARPALDPAAVDTATLPLIPRMMQALGQGDDGALRAVLSIFEDAGLSIRAAQDLVPDLVPPEGPLGTHAPGPAHAADIARGRAVLAAMAVADTGQGCVVRRGQAIAIEAQPGTDWMLDSIVTMQGDGGVFLKGPKPGQDRRIDMPSIGPLTISRVAKARLDGIVLTGDVLVLDREEVARRADEAGVFVAVEPPHDGS